MGAWGRSCNRSRLIDSRLSSVQQQRRIARCLLLGAGFREQAPWESRSCLDTPRRQRGTSDPRMSDDDADLPATAFLEGGGPLFVAARRGEAEDVRRLLAGRADVAAQSWFGQATPLHVSARGGHVEVVRMLLGAGADVAGADREGATALHYGAGEGQGEVAKVLLDAGAGLSPSHSQVLVLTNVSLSCICSKSNHVSLPLSHARVGSWY